ncbi:hypothetical protein ELS19_07950 [Halogeometricum borinquense]|uniref:Pyrrolo-quinoline quinone repeat domain-containing protein n=1 Tax=Halogeometricum borinquense TaxID=60847 RepID=A0A482TFC9_9EURY|nr:PQQ-binding-like beta-propeller repeat protein [Halogeometricum borinquense]RYJ13908.1 hypothetical protein ELS19_07950 [Halogeometricum borinquense]
MVSRRRFLGLGAGTLAVTAGCLGTRRSDGTAAPTNESPATPDSTSESTGDDSSKTPRDLPEWTPDWTLSFDNWHVLGIDVADSTEIATATNTTNATNTGDGLLFTTLRRDGGNSAVAAVDPSDASVRWRTKMDGEAVSGSHAAFQRIARGQWGATLTAETVYSVAGNADEREWTELYALDRSNGERRWSLKRDRKLAVAGVSDGLLVATGLEFFPPPNETPVSHQTPEEPLTTVVYGLDVTDGAVRWTREFTAVRDVAVGPEGIYVAAGDRLLGLGRDGETQFTVDDGPAKWIEVADERLFFLAGEGDGATLHGVAPNGDGDWKHDVPVEELLLDGDRLYAGGDSVLAVDADGTVAWRDDNYGQWLLLDPDGDTLYTRSGVRADAATAYSTAGEKRWTFDPPSNNAWPEAATADAMVATAITADDSDDLFKTVYAVDSAGEATAAFGRDTVFDAVGRDDTVYLADGQSNLLALTP